MSDSDWYYAKDNRQLGPVTLESLRDLLRTGTITPQDLVWTTGMNQWQPCGTVAALFGVNPVAAVSLPMPPPGAFPIPNYSSGIPDQFLNYDATQRVVYGGFWIRFIAAFLDGLLLMIVQIIIIAILIMLATATGGGRPVNNSFAGIGQLLGIVIGWIYGASMESSAAQATLGKMALGLRVTDLSGGRLTFGRATGRHFAKMISVFTLFIGYMMAGWTGKKQALHDLIASTLVVRKD